jgi:hypothetical protein
MSAKAWPTLAEQNEVLGWLGCGREDVARLILRGDACPSRLPPPRRPPLVEAERLARAEARDVARERLRQQVAAAKGYRVAQAALAEVRRQLRAWRLEDADRAARQGRYTRCPLCDTVQLVNLDGYLRQHDACRADIDALRLPRWRTPLAARLGACHA